LHLKPDHPNARLNAGDRDWGNHPIGSPPHFASIFQDAHVLNTRAGAVRQNPFANPLFAATINPLA
jgi:hypothetical protein